MNPEERTVKRMIEMYCRAHHRGDTVPCRACSRLMEYAEMRIENCPFGEEKPVCSACTVHCYIPEMREQIRAVMRYAGPRMLIKYPISALHHLIRSRKRPRRFDA